MDITNVIDLTAIANALEGMGTSLSNVMQNANEQTKALFSALILTEASEAQNSAAANEVRKKAMEEQNSLLERALNLMKFAGIGIAGYFFWKGLK